MTSGDASVPPDWKVRYDDALRKWLRSDPPLHLVSFVVAWIDSCKAYGPPDDGVTSDGEYHVAPIHGTQLSVAYIPLAYERMVIVKDIG